ncbi:hypothetical protein J6590_073561 [Homalodisca vitripennis]|nr:hypothetical protein J6590_073561 [Homalodisca vitripennis]
MDYNWERISYPTETCCSLRIKTNPGVTLRISLPESSGVTFTLMSFSMSTYVLSAASHIRSHIRKELYESFCLADIILDDIATSCITPAFSTLDIMKFYLLRTSKVSSLYLTKLRSRNSPDFEVEVIGAPVGVASVPTHPFFKMRASMKKSAVAVLLSTKPYFFNNKNDVRQVIIPLRDPCSIGDSDSP